MWAKKIFNNREFPSDFISEKVLSFLLFCYCWGEGQSVSEEEERIVLNWVLWSFPHIFLPIFFLQLKLIASLITTSTQLTHLISCLQRRQNLHRFVSRLNLNANVFSVNIYCHHFVGHYGAFCGEYNGDLGELKCISARLHVRVNVQTVFVFVFLLFDQCPLNW